jgi:hypothetical protein
LDGSLFSSLGAPQAAILRAHKPQKEVKNYPQKVVASFAAPLGFFSGSV